MLFLQLLEAANILKSNKVMRYCLYLDRNYVQGCLLKHVIQCKQDELIYLHL